MARKIPRLDGRIEYDPVQTDTFYSVIRRYLPIRISLFDIPPGSIVQITTTSEHDRVRFLRWHNTYAFKVNQTTARDYERDFLICLNGSIAMKIYTPKPKFCYTMKYRIDDRKRRPVMIRYEMHKMRFILRERIETRETSSVRSPRSPALDLPPGSLLALSEDSSPLDE